MSTVIAFPREHYPTLRIEEDASRDVYWAYMHGNHEVAPVRSCFNSELVGDLRRYQDELGARLRNRPLTTHQDGGPVHLVLGSVTDAFSLGGDLALFSRLIQERNREALHTYAHEAVRLVHGFHAGLHAGAHTIALVQGDALGGGFEIALSCHTIVAERGVLMGLPEVLFDLFPGMGAYSFMCQRVSPQVAEKIMLEGRMYTSDEFYKMGLVDVLVPKGEGLQAVEDAMRANRRRPNARAALHQVREPLPIGELMRITDIWVETALRLGDRSIRTMDRLVRAQSRRGGVTAAAREVI